MSVRKYVTHRCISVCIHTHVHTHEHTFSKSFVFLCLADKLDDDIKIFFENALKDVDNESNQETQTAKKMLQGGASLFH